MGEVRSGVREVGRRLLTKKFSNPSLFPSRMPECFPAGLYLSFISSSGVIKPIEGARLNNRRYNTGERAHLIAEG